MVAMHNMSERKHVIEFMNMNVGVVKDKRFRYIICTPRFAHEGAIS